MNEVDLTGFNTSSWHTYPSIFALGHKATQPLMVYPDLIVEEKIDGSQFSFGIFDGELRMKSKNASIVPGYIPGLFSVAGATVEDLAQRGMLHNGWTYRGEALNKPKHNALTYSRIPVGGVILYDINTSHSEFLEPGYKKAEADRLGLECVPVLHRGTLNLELFKSLLETDSVLGGAKIEGVVVKPAGYDLFGLDKKVLLGKFVSEAFKEVHRKEWGAANPKGKDIVTFIAEQLRVPARWQKAVQRMAEEGILEGQPRDIGTLLRYVAEDLDKEVQEDVKEALFKHFWRDIKRSSMWGIAEWYKETLLTQAFEESVGDECKRQSSLPTDSSVAEATE